MGVLSKILLGDPSSFQPTCHEAGHIWEPSCVKATIDVAHVSVLHCLKIYMTLYGLNALIRKKGIEHFKGNFWREVIQSTLHLSSCATLFMTAFCIVRRLTGKFRPLTIVFTTSIFISGLALQVERENRKGTLVLYMLYQALECVTRTALKYDLIKPLRNAEILMFSVGCSGLAYFFRLNKLQGIQSVLQYLIGSDEVISTTDRSNEPDILTDQSSSESIADQSRLITTGRDGIPKSLYHLAASLFKWLRSLSKHHLCKHKDSCISYCFKGSTKLVGLGILMQLLTNIKRVLRIFSQSPTLMAKVIGSWKSYQLPAFLASLSVLYKAASCIMRWATNTDYATNGLVAGLVSGLSMLMFRSYTIALSVMLKLLEVLCHKGQEKGYIPLIPYIQNIIYGLSVGITFHGAITDPTVLNPSYWRFLLTNTNQMFGLFDRAAIVKAAWGGHQS